MCAGSGFEDTVKICEFYSTDEYPIHVNRDGRLIELGDGEFVIDPVMEGGNVVVYIVEDPSGVCRLVSDLDDYFQSMLPDWREEP